MMECRMKNGNHLARLLAYVTGLVNQELLLQNEYLAAENRILRAHLPARLLLSDSERCTLAEIGKRLGREALEKVACVAKPETIIAWYRRVIARKFDGSQCRTYLGRPTRPSCMGPQFPLNPIRVARTRARLPVSCCSRSARNRGRRVAQSCPKPPSSNA
jgi:hypothetical protein